MITTFATRMAISCACLVMRMRSTFVDTPSVLLPALLVTEIVLDPITVNVVLDGLVLIAPNVWLCLVVLMVNARFLLNANVNLDGLACFAINPFVRTLVNMVIVPSLGSASKFANTCENQFCNLSISVAILDGPDPIVTSALNCLAALTMASAPNPWSANANPDGLDIFAINPFAVKDAMKPLDTAPNLVNVGVAWDGLDPNVRPAFLTLDVKMGTASNLGNACVLEIIKECFVILNWPLAMNCPIQNSLSTKPAILMYLNF